jgi:hypothetical protein
MESKDPYRRRILREDSGPSTAFGGYAVSLRSG